MKKSYRITIYALGTSPKQTMSYAIVYANSVEEAENAFKVPYGYAILSVCEVNDFDLTFAQENAIKERLDKILSIFIEKKNSREAIIDAVIEEVMDDIECSAGWERLQSDEWVESDIDMAFQRVLENYILD